MFSLNFSSAGKGPFMDGKAKNIYFSKRGGGGGSGVRDMDPPSLGNFLFPYFRDWSKSTEGGGPEQRGGGS